MGRIGGDTLYFGRVLKQLIRTCGHCLTGVPKEQFVCSKEDRVEAEKLFGGDDQIMIQKWCSNYSQCTHFVNCLISDLLFLPLRDIILLFVTVLFTQIFIRLLVSLYNIIIYHRFLCLLPLSF